MKRVERRSVYQPQKVSQGFNPVRVGDITPFLRDNQRTKEVEMARQDKAAQRDFEMQVKDEQLKALNSQRDTAALLKFAPKAQERLEQFAKDQIAEEKVNAIQWLQNSKAERAQIVGAQSAAENELQELEKANRAQTDLLADAKNKDPDMPYSLIDEANKSSSWAQFFRVQLATEEVSRNIISDISTDIREDNIVDEFGKRWSELDPDEWEYAYNVREKIGLKANNVTANTTIGMDLTHGAPIREKGKKQLRDQHTKNYYISQSQKESTLAWGMLQSKPSKEAAENYLHALSRELGTDGVTLKGFNHAQKTFFSNLLDLAKTDPTLADDLLIQYGQLELQGQKFETLHSNRISNFYADRMKFIESNHDQIDDILEDMLINGGRKMLEPIANNPEANYANVLDVRERQRQLFISYGMGHLYDPKKMGINDAMKNISYSGQETAALEYQAQYRADRGKLDAEFYESLPPELQTRFADAWDRQQTLDSLSVETIKEDVKNNVMRNSYVKDSAASDKAAWGGLVYQDLWQEILSSADNMMQDKDNVNRTYAQAIAASAEKVTAKFLAGVKDQDSIYYHGDEGYRAYLEHKVGDLDEKTATFRRRHDKLIQEAKLIGRSALAKPGYVGSNEYLMDVKTRAEKGEMDSYVQSLVKQLGGNYFDTLNLILRSNGLEELDMDYQPPELNASVAADVKRIHEGTATRISQFRLTQAYRNIRPNLAQVVPAINPENLGNMDPSGFDWQARVTPDVTRRKGEFLMKYMTEDLKMGENHAMGLLINGLRESTLRTTIAGDGGLSDGMFQWHKSRLTKARQALGEYWNDPRAQIKYALEEAGEPGQEYLRMNFASPQAAADWWMIKWERPADPDRDSRVHSEFLRRWRQGGV